VAVRTDDLAFGNLVQDAAPAAITQPLRDVERLVTQVVELENEWIGLAAIDAWIRTEILHEISDSFAADRNPAPSSPVDVQLAICSVMGAVVFRHTRAAVRVPRLR
jgi:hypothetical protein